MNGIACRSPVLILEGFGDREAVPFLIREIFTQQNVFDFNPLSNPIINQNAPKLLAAGQLERMIGYAQKRDGDSILIILDADKDCPVNIARDFFQRLSNMELGKKTGLIIFNSEFEVLFLYCLDLIAGKYDYGWELGDWDPLTNFEDVAGAKGLITRHMKPGKSYKETRDQAKFVSVLDFDRLRERSRCFRHLESTLNWLAGAGEGMVYPTFE